MHSFYFYCPNNHKEIKMCMWAPACVCEYVWVCVCGVFACMCVHVCVYVCALVCVRVCASLLLTWQAMEFWECDVKLSESTASD